MGKLFLSGSLVISFRLLSYLAVLESIYEVSNSTNEVILENLSPLCVLVHRLWFDFQLTYRYNFEL